MTRNPLKRTVKKDTGFKGENPDIIRGARENNIVEVRAALLNDWREITRQDVNFSMSALHYAASKGNESMVRFLLDQKGVDLNLKDRWGRDVLDAAILCGHQEIIDQLFRFRRQQADQGERGGTPPTAEP